MVGRRNVGDSNNENETVSKVKGKIRFFTVAGLIWDPREAEAIVYKRMSRRGKSSHRWSRIREAGGGTEMYATMKNKC